MLLLAEVGNKTIELAYFSSKNEKTNVITINNLTTSDVSDVKLMESSIALPLSSSLIAVGSDHARLFYIEDAKT